MQSMDHNGDVSTEQGTDWIRVLMTGLRRTGGLVRILHRNQNLSTDSPQGCVLGSLLYCLYTFNCTPTHFSNYITKLADDATMVGLISGRDESAYRDEVDKLSAWRVMNNLTLSNSKTKEIIMDFHKRSRDPAPLFINGACV